MSHPPEHTTLMTTHDNASTLLRECRSVQTTRLFGPAADRNARREGATSGKSVDGLLMPGTIAQMSRTPAEPGPAPTVPVPVAAVLAGWKG